MSEFSKEVSGIDMASEKFDVCFKASRINQTAVIKGTKTFDNDNAGFNKYLMWCQKRSKTEDLIHIVEATGVYHENLCYFLFEHGQSISVQLPQKAKYFIKSLNIKTKTDKTDASALAEMGFSRRFELWKPLSSSFRNIRDLSRTLVRLKNAQTATKSQIHALNHAHQEERTAINLMGKLLSTQKEIIEECEIKILKLVDKDEALRKRIDRITKIKGIGTLTVVKLLAETDGFRNVKSIKSLVSYSGLDVAQNQSGKMKGKPRISKKGNAYIRAALYMPAMSAVQHDEKSKAFYERLNERLPKKRQSLVAVMRKLLITIYALWKNEEEYDVNHNWEKQRRGLSPVTG